MPPQSVARASLTALSPAAVRSHKTKARRRQRVERTLRNAGQPDQRHLLRAQQVRAAAVDSTLEQQIAHGALLNPDDVQQAAQTVLDDLKRGHAEEEPFATDIDDDADNGVEYRIVKRTLRSLRDTLHRTMRKQIVVAKELERRRGTGWINYVKWLAQHKRNTDTDTLNLYSEHEKLMEPIPETPGTAERIQRLEAVSDAIPADADDRDNTVEAMEGVMR